ncbi:MAG: MFS transporter [Armatimonadota bacterium]
MSNLATEPRRPTKWPLLLIEVCQSFACTLLMFGQPFYSRHVLHWPIWRIALVQMLVGLLSIAGSLAGGRGVQRLGAKHTMLIGYTGLSVGALLGLTAPAGWNLFLAVIFTALFQGCIFTSVQSSLTRGEDARNTQKYVSAFNISWSSASSVAFFVITPIMSSYGPPALFILPLLCLCVNCAATLISVGRIQSIPETDHSITGSQGETVPERRRRIFRHIGWIANPCAYLMINVINPCNPVIAKQLGLQFAVASSWLSAWFFMRMLTFWLFRCWNGWQFRINVMLGCFAVMVIAFTGVMMSQTLWLQVLSQVLFGGSVAMTIQMSLFYSLVGSRTRGRHAGIHEGVVAAGSALGAGLAALGDWLGDGRLEVTWLLALGILCLSAIFIATHVMSLRRPLSV